MMIKKISLSIITLTFLSGVIFTPLSTAYAQGGAGAVVDSASCLGSQVVSKTVQGAISGVLGKVTNVVTNRLNPAVPNTEVGQQLANSNVDTAAHTGSGFSFFGVNLNLFPSWDAIAYCIGNAVITWVADSVTQWINGGFNGSPSFIDNPQQFFTQLADETATSFVSGLIKGTIGVDVCKPFQVAIGLSAQTAYNSNYGNSSKCTLDTVTSNIENFYSSKPQYFDFNKFYSASQNPANNYWGSVTMAQNQLKLNLNTQSTLAREMLLRNNGYRDVVECQWTTTTTTGPDGKPVTTKTPIDGTCKTTVTGSDTQKAGQDSRNMANLRLVAATKFDQVITALVNQLIKTALSELLTVTR